MRAKRKILFAINISKCESLENDGKPTKRNHFQVETFFITESPRSRFQPVDTHVLVKGPLPLFFSSSATLYLSGHHLTSYKAVKKSMAKKKVQQKTLK